MSTLTTKFTDDFKSQLLNELFGFTVDDEGVVYDDNGDEFHAIAENDAVDLSTLGGVIAYHGELQYNKGIQDGRTRIKKCV